MFIQWKRGNIAGVKTSKNNKIKRQNNKYRQTMANIISQKAPNNEEKKRRSISL